MRVRPPSLPIILIMALIPGAGVYAQSFSGTVRGTATDSSGAILPNVKVTLINESTGESRTQPTSDLGTYTFPQVAPGLYRLEGVPVFAESAAFGDIIEAGPVADGRLRFVRVAEPGNAGGLCASSLLLLWNVRHGG